MRVAVRSAAGLCLAAALGVSALGCASTIPLDRGVLAYDRAIFSLLYQLFQMTVSAPARAGPAITIAK